MMILLRNEPQTFLGRKAVRLVQTKEHNRAVHSGEKSDKGREGSKVVCGWFADKFDGTLLCGLGKSARNSNATQPMR